MSKTEDLKQARVTALFKLPDTKFIRFKGAPLMSAPGTDGFKPINGELFATLVYTKFGTGVSNSSIKDMLHAVSNTAPDWTDKAHLIGFNDKRWNMKTLAFEDELDWVYSSNIMPNDNPTDIANVQGYLLGLAAGDKELAYDYLQLMAPLLMHTKPVGIIWLVGAGANGKSLFLDAWEMILGDHFSHLTIDMIEDGRATPSLRGVLGNIVQETSEKRVEDMQKYKNIGAHETFDVRVLGTHDVVHVDTNFHTVFSANNIPVFADKTMGSRRRTILVPFPAKFTDDPGFKERTFTKGFLGALLHLTLEATKDVSKHGYKWSAAQLDTQGQYNADANTAEAYGRHLDELGVVAFKNYTLLKTYYEAWCSNESLVPLGRTQLARAIEATLQTKQRVYKDDEVTIRRYIKDDVDQDDIVWLDNGYGMKKTNKPILNKQEIESGW